MRLAIGLLLAINVVVPATPAAPPTTEDVCRAIAARTGETWEDACDRVGLGDLLVVTIDCAHSDAPECDDFQREVGDLDGGAL